MSKPNIIALPPLFEKRRITLRRSLGQLLAITVLAFHCAQPAMAATPEQTLKAHERSIKTLKQRIRDIDAELQADKELYGRESNKLRETEQEIAERASALRTIAATVKQQTAQTRELRTQQQQAEETLLKQRAQLAAQLRASYQNGKQEKVKLLLNQGNPARLGRLLGYHDYLAKSRTEKIQQVREQTAALQALEIELHKQLAQLQTLSEIQQAQLANLESARVERKTRVAELAAEIAASGKTLSRMQSEQGALKRLVTAIRKRLSDIPAQYRDAKPLSQSEGRLPWPLKGRLLASYGQEKNGTSMQWDGVWIAAKAGTPVRAVAEGRVVYVGWLHRYGLLVITEHQDGYYSLYGHNQSAKVEVGDQAKAGQIIAYAGDSGGHAKSGLYFELRKGKNPVNPMRWFSKR